MTIVYLICLLYFVLGGICHITGSVISIAKIRKAIKDSVIALPPKNPNIYIVVPVYKEQRVIVESLDFFSHFVNKSVKKCIFVTTERERAESTITTNDIILAYLSDHPNCPIQVLEAPAEYEGKSGQINFVLSHLQQHDTVSPFDYIGIYDVDSRPMLSSLKVLGRVLDSYIGSGKECPCVLQQIPIYCQNIDKFGLDRLFCLNDLISQSQWSIGFEYPLLRIYQKAVADNRIVPLVYCIGHGCFISLKFLETINGIPTINRNDDLSLGYLLSCLHDEVAPLPMVDFCEIAPSVHDSIRQSKNWAIGSFRFWRDVRTYLEYYEIQMSFSQKICLWMEGNLRNFFWAYRGIMLLLLFALTPVNPVCLTGTIVAVVLYCIIPYILTFFFINSLKGLTGAAAGSSWFNCLIGTLTSPVTLLLRSIGPFCAQFSHWDTNFKVNRI